MCESYGVRPSAYFRISLEDEGDLALAFDTTVRFRGQKFRDDRAGAPGGATRPKTNEDIQVQRAAQAAAFEEIQAKLDKVRGRTGG